MTEGQDDAQDTRIAAIWKSMDKHKGGNGEIDATTLQEYLTANGQFKSAKELRQAIQDADANKDGLIEYREFRALFEKLNHEGDVIPGDEAYESLGTSELHQPRTTLLSDLYTVLFGSLSLIFYRPRPPEPSITSPNAQSLPPTPMSQSAFKAMLGDNEAEKDTNVAVDSKMKIDPSAPLQTQTAQDHASQEAIKLTMFLPTPGYFAAGALAGIVSRTMTAPLDRLKVHLIAQTETAGAAVEAAKKGAPIQATKHAANTLINATKDLWAAGGMQSMYAGNGLNVLKVMPESALKFGCFEGTKLAFTRMLGHEDPKELGAFSNFMAGGIGGMLSQAIVYPLDTMKFRMQCETVKGGPHGWQLIRKTYSQLRTQGGFYRGLLAGVGGMFPYAAIDLGTFDLLKKTARRRAWKQAGLTDEADLDKVELSQFQTGSFGAFSGALGATAVYPINLIRTRLQTQGTAVHRRTYTGMRDCFEQTVKTEGWRGLYKGLTPNLLKVVPAVSITYLVYENSKKILHLH